MKSIVCVKSHQLIAAGVLCVLVPVLHAGTVNTTFSFQKGDLRQDGALYGSGASYTGVVDGQLSDGNATSVLTTTATSTLGNAYQAGSPNGRQYVGLFSYNLTDLSNFIAANTSSSSSVAVTSVAFKLISAGANSGTASSIRLYGTDPFTSGATWSNYTTGTPWTVPYQNIGSSAQYGYTGGGSALTPSLGGTSPNTGVTSGNVLQWTSSANFITAVTNALARGDKTLYLTANVAITAWGGGSDQRLAVNCSPATTVDNRPELLISVAVNTFSDWTGASGTSWATAGNWTTAPTTGDNVRFNASSTANLATGLNQDFNLGGVALINPTGPVSIGGANSLTLGAGGLDLSAATQNLAITAPLVLGTAQTWNVASGRTLGISGTVTGSVGLTIFGAGKVSLGASNILPNGAGAGNLILSGTMDLNGTTQSVNGLTGSGTIDNVAGGGASVLTIGNNNAACSFSGILQNTSGTLALHKVGSGSLTLTGPSTNSGGFTNDGTGDVTPNNNGAFGSGPVVSNAGQLYATATTIFSNTLALNGATLRIGGGGSKTITWNGPVTATGTSGLSADGGTAGITLGSTLDIAGATFSSYANGTTNSITGAISGAGGNLRVTGGTLRLSGTNTYSGATSINAGSLVLAAGNALPDTSAVTIGNATLDAATFTDTAGTLDVTNTATIHLGTGAALAFANSSAISWTGTLHLTGTFISGSSLRFGTDNTGLTSTQLALISAAGFTTFRLDDNGYLTVSPYEAWLAAAGKSNTPENLREYALGTANPAAIIVNSPTSITLGQAPALQIAGITASAVYGRRLNYQESGLAYKVKFSADLVTWHDSTDTANLIYAGPPGTPVVVATDGEMEAVSIPFPLFIKTDNGYEKTRSFMMIEVTNTP